MNNKIFLDSSILVEYRKGTQTDALILAICQFHDIRYLASFDSDYVHACQAEGIFLISNKAQLKAIS